MARGCFCLVLHSHIPYTKKAGRWPFGEEWLYEAMAETYIPIVKLLRELSSSSPGLRVCVGITPVLMEQLTDDYLKNGFLEYLDDLIMRADSDVARFALTNEYRLRNLAEMYRGYYIGIREYYDKLGRDIVSAFRGLQDSGVIEVITSAATHAYLPLVRRDFSISMQLAVGREIYRRYMGRDPRGIWLPECGYRPGITDSGTSDDQSRPGLERYLSNIGVRYFFVDSHAIEGGNPSGIYSAVPRRSSQQPSEEGRLPAADGRQPAAEKTTFRPYSLEGTDIAVFGRDRRTGIQVWSSEWGYPADQSYREFHRRDDQSGLRYWRITSRFADIGSKDLYDHDEALRRAEEQANHFCELVANLLINYNAQSGQTGILVAPFDIELFGHWWFEGVHWLRCTLERLGSSSDILTVTPSEYLAMHPPTETIRLRESSWGTGGKHSVWLNESTEWLWKDLQEAEDSIAGVVAELDPDGNGENGRLRRLLNQASRELMLMQSSDWPFLITTGQAAEYARARFNDHKNRFYRILRAISSKGSDAYSNGDMDGIEQVDSLFGDIDISAFISS